MQITNLANSFKYLLLRKSSSNKKDKDALNNLALVSKGITLIEPIPQLFYIKWWNNITNQLSLKIWSVLLITGIWLSSFFLILFIKNRKSGNLMTI